MAGEISGIGATGVHPGSVVRSGEPLGHLRQPYAVVDGRGRSRERTMATYAHARPGESVEDTVKTLQSFMRSVMADPRASFVRGSDGAELRGPQAVLELGRIVHRLRAQASSR